MGLATYYSPQGPASTVTPTGAALTGGKQLQQSDFPTYQAYLDYLHSGNAPGSTPTAYSTSQTAGNQAGSTAGQAGTNSSNNPDNPNGVPLAPPTSDSPNSPTYNPYMENAFNQYGGAYLQPGYGDQVMPGLIGKLQGTTNAQQFFTQAENTDTDPNYQRMQQQGLDAIDQQQAARGHYNSGGAIAGEGNFESGLKAGQYAQLGGLASAADSSNNAESGLLGQVTQGADQTDLNKLNGYFGAAGATSGANQSAINSYLTQQSGIDSGTAQLIETAMNQAGNQSGAAGMGALQAEVQGILAKSGATQAQQQGILQALGLVAAVA